MRAAHHQELRAMVDEAIATADGDDLVLAELLIAIALGMSARNLGARKVAEIAKTEIDWLESSAPDIRRNLAAEGRSA
jgi:hypothetical protein